MPHFAIICPPISGHLDPLAAVGRALIRRGHRVSVFHISDVKSKVTAQGLEFIPLDRSYTDSSKLGAAVRHFAQLQGRASLKFAVQCAREISVCLLKNGPEALVSAAVDGLIVDQNEPAGGTLAEHLQIPFVSACTSLPLNRESAIPPPFVRWKYSSAVLAKLRNSAGYVIADRLIAPIESEINCYRSRWGLRRLAGPDTSFSKLAQIAQMPRAFDFPRQGLPNTFHYLGPWFDDVPSAGIAFPFEKLDGRPLIYGSIGTLQAAHSPMFRVMAEACASLEVQLVLSLGQPQTAAAADLPGNTLVVNYAPQIELLKRAAATITHGGMNTTQQSLYFGVPMVVVPLAHDQPAIAARVARTGAGIVFDPARLSAAKLREALQQLLRPDNDFRKQARRLQTESQAAGGAEAAATIIERTQTRNSGP